MYETARFQDKVNRSLIISKLKLSHLSILDLNKTDYELLGLVILAVCVLSLRFAVVRVVSLSVSLFFYILFASVFLRADGKRERRLKLSMHLLYREYIEEATRIVGATDE